MIDHKTVNEILSKADIVEVVSEFVTLKKAGVNYKGLCPFHNEKTPSFVVSPSKGICHCFSCGKGGNLVHFLMEHEQMTFSEALRWLAKKYNVQIQEKELTPEELLIKGERESLFIVNEWANKYFQYNLYNTSDGKTLGLTYLRDRGLRDDIIQKFQLGYCLSGYEELGKEALKEGYKEEYLLKTGLCYKRDDGKLNDKYHGRVIFPVHTLSGKVVAFGGRVLGGDKKVAKYINSPESEIYHKSNELYGIYQAKSSIVKKDACFLVEGYMDVIAMFQSGVENVVASSGTSLTDGQIRMLHRFTSNITVLYDGDMAGIKASLRGINMLLEEGLNIKVLLLPDGDDPDSFSRKNTAQFFQNYIDSHQEDFISFKIKILLNAAGADPIKRAGVISNIIESIAVIPDALIRSVYLQECSRLLNVKEDVLIAETAKQRRKNYYEKKKQEENRQQREEQAVQETLLDEPKTSIVSAEQVESKNLSKITSKISEKGLQYSLPETGFNTQALQPPKTNREKMEAILIQMIVRYGELTIANIKISETEEQSISVIDYIFAELENDKIMFENRLFAFIWEKALEHCHDEGFVSSRYFLSFPDVAVSQIAAKMLSNSYQLSESFAKEQNITPTKEKLFQLVPMQIAKLKLSILSDEAKESLLKLRSPELINDTEKFKEEMIKYQQLNQLKKELATQCGETKISL